MARVVRLRPARALFVSVALGVGAAMSGCGTDTIDLLPPTVGGSGGGDTNTAGDAGEGPSEGGRGATGGGGSAGNGGSAGTAGQGRGGNAGCSSFGCGGFGNASGVGGNGFDCTQYPALCDCGPDGKCGFGTKCHPTEHVCVAKCDGPEQCGNSGKVCLDHLCSSCMSNQSCEQYGSFQRHVCVQAIGLCLECEEKSDCPPERPLCDEGRCVECFDDEDCPDGEQCDQLRKRCSK